MYSNRLPRITVQYFSCSTLNYLIGILVGLYEDYSFFNIDGSRGSSKAVAYTISATESVGQKMIVNKICLLFCKFLVYILFLIGTL